MSAREALVAKLRECGTAGIIETTDAVQAFFSSDFNVSSIVSQLSEPVLEITCKVDWVKVPNTFRNHDPIYAGRQFFIVSSGSDNPTPCGRHRLTIDANDAFGSGSHESTQLAVEALENFLFPGATVLDVGCGSGILSAVAQKLGAGGVFACDTHIGSLHSARRHSANSHFFAGSVDSARLYPSGGTTQHIEEGLA